jgi:hypothetical protein
MEFTLPNIDGLIAKFTDELVELQDALEVEDDAAIVTELQSALSQSKDLLDELKCVRDVFVDVTHSGRAFSDDEVAAAKYFGFIPTPRGQPAVARPTFELPPRSSASTGRLSTDESETDPEQLPARYPVYRPISPEEEIRSVPAIPFALPNSPPAARPLPVSVSPESVRRFTEDDVREQARLLAHSMVEAERKRMQAELLDRSPVIDKDAVARAVAAERKRSDAELRDAQQSFDAEIAAVRRGLQSALQEARETAASAQSDAERAKRQAHAATSAAEEMAQQLEVALQSTAKDDAVVWRAEWVEFVRSAMKEQFSGIYEPELRGLRDENRSLKRKIDEYLSLGSTDDSQPPDLTTASVALASARATLDNCSALTAFNYTVNAVSGSEESDALDRAVAEELNALGFPTALAVRRLGAAGDYCIDRRVQLRLANGQVMVKRAGAQSSTYEPLGKYLVRLYAPLLLATGSRGLSMFAAHRASPQPVELSPEHPHGGTDGITAATNEGGGDPADHIRRLQQEQRQLTAELAKQRQLLQSSHSAQASQSPQRSYEMMNPPSLSAEFTPQRDTVGSGARVLSLNEQLRRSQKQHLEETLSARVPYKTYTTGRPVAEPPVRAPAASVKSPSAHHAPNKALAQMSEEEIELLKKIALAKQIRDNRRQQQIHTRNR